MSRLHGRIQTMDREQQSEERKACWPPDESSPIPLHRTVSGAGRCRKMRDWAQNCDLERQ